MLSDVARILLSVLVLVMPGLAQPIRHQVDLRLLLGQHTRWTSHSHKGADRRKPNTQAAIFGPAALYDSNGYIANSLAVGDFNNDGHLDVAIQNDCFDSTCTLGSNVTVLLGNGDGTFQAGTSFGSGGFGEGSITEGDINNDGNPDLVTASPCLDSSCLTSSVGVLLGNGNGTFQTPIAYPTGFETRTAALADLNGDGKLDIIAGNACADSTCSGDATVEVFLGNGDGTFQTPATYDSGGFGALSIAAADVNTDGKLDLIIGNIGVGQYGPTGAVAVLLGNGDGTFGPAVTYSSGGFALYGVKVGDVNGDNKPDAVVINECASINSCPGGAVGVLIGNGDGTFQSAASYGSGGYVGFSLVLSDVNGDGYLDALAVNQCGDSMCEYDGAVGVLLGNGDGTFQSPVVSDTGSPNALSAAVADLNSDGKPDLLVTDQTCNPPYCDTGALSVLLNVSSTAVGISPLAVNFGNQTVGIMSNPTIVTVTSTGSRALAITSIVLNGANTGDFTETNNCPSLLLANNSCTVTITFSPLSTGTRTASVVITDNALGSPQSVSLTGTGVTPTATLSTTSLTFPTQVVFTTSKTQTVTLTNTGLGVLTIASITVSGQFTQTNTCGSAVNPGSSCQISITFKPTTKGVLSGSVSIVDNAAGSPQTIALTGTGTYIQLSPTGVNFGSQPVGTTSLAHKITITNKGSTSVSISKISITGINAADFSETNNCGTSIGAGASCFIKVSFTPSTTGTRTGTVSITDNGGGSPQKVSLKGTGT